MFNNVGKKIKIIAKIIFVLICVVAVIAIIADLFITLQAGQVSEKVSAQAWVTFFIVVAISIIVVSLSAVALFFIYGYGELIETNQEIRDGLNYLIQERSIAIAKTYNSEPEKENEVTGHSGKWKCTKCGEENSNDTIICKNCGKNMYM